MIDQDLDADEFHFGTLLRQLPHKRWRHACAMLARQQALKIAGADWQAYFDENRGRLLQDAAEQIETKSALAKYRKSQTITRIIIR
jgi:hypothetical protein